MKTLGIAAGSLVCAATTAALAQSPPQPPPSEAARDVVTGPVGGAPSKALELGVQAGYTQGFGASISDPRVGAGAGGTVGLSLDDRIHPRWSFGVGGQYEGYGSSGRQASPATLRGVTAGVHGTYHLSPYDWIDPHVTLGVGYRLFVESPAGDSPSTLTHGVELGKVQVGLDLRPSSSVAISPVIGADLNLFAWRARGLGIAPSANPSVSAFVFAGLEGRFDVGGTRENKPAPAP